MELTSDTAAPTGGSLVSGLVMGIATAALLVLIPLAAASDEGDWFWMVRGGLLLAVGVGIVLTALYPQFRRMWVGFVLGLMGTCIFVVSWLWNALGQVGS